MMANKQIYVAWTNFQRRPCSMRSYFDYEIQFIGPKVRHRWLKSILSYPVQGWQTFNIVLRRRPDVLWIQAPPNFLIHIAWLLRLIRAHQMKVIADLHNASLSRFWLAVPLTRRLLNTFDLVLVHNEDVRAMAVAKGIHGDRIRVLEDCIPEIETPAAAPKVRDKPRIVMPCSFSKDEPVPNVVEAARMEPSIDFFITGDDAKARRQGFMDDLPPNVVFTGFLDPSSYDRLIADSAGILCLTTKDGIQLSAASEALGAGKPMIISDTSLLRSLFGTGLFVDNSPGALRDACRAVVADYTRFAAETLMLRHDRHRLDRWQAQAGDVKRSLTLENAQPR